MITVRTAKKEDIPHILKIAESVLIPRWTHKSIEHVLETGDSLLLVAEEQTVCKDSKLADSNTAHSCCDLDDTVATDYAAIGFAAFRQVDVSGELLQIAVEKQKRRQGVGSALFGAICCYAEEKGLESIFLEVRISNEGAISFYEKHGFKQLRVRKDYYNDPIEDAIVMVKTV